MKYSDGNPPIRCMLTHSTCYQGTRPMKVLGVLWHSTGANNPYLWRYVQPYETDPDYAEKIALLGKNNYRTDYNHKTVQAGLNAFVGKLPDGTVAAVQTMPWDYAPWGCGSGPRGSCNSGWIQFEICEDGLDDPVYFEKAYREAVELTAFLCKRFRLTPRGSVVFGGVSVPVILCHQDSYRLGLGSNHGDVLHWLPKFGKSMEDVRNDVQSILEEDDMTGKEIFERLNEYTTTMTLPDWAKEEYQKAIDAGVTDGTNPMGLIPRYQAALMAYRTLHRESFYEREGDSGK